MTDAPRNATVLDTTVLSNFAHVDAVGLLLDLPRVVTVDVVRSELEEGVATHPYLDRAVAVLDDDLPVVTPNEPAQKLEQELLGTLDPGETQAVAVAEASEGTIVTDDGDARTVANRRGIDLTGSIGVLVRGIENRELSVEKGDEFLKQWVDEGDFRAPARDIDVFLEE